MNALRRPLLLLVGYNLVPTPWLRPAAISLAVGLVVALRFAVEGRRGPTRFYRIAMQILAFAFVTVHFGTLIDAEAAGALLTLTLALKMFEIETARDQFVAFCLCLLTLMSDLLLDQSLLITIYMVVDFVALTLFLFALGEGKLTWRRGALWSTLVAMVKALPLVLVTFVLFPRFSTGFGPGETPAGQIGVTDSLRPGSIAALAGSNQLVFRADFLGEDPPPRAALYWRGATLSVSDGLNWDRGSSPRQPAPVPTGDPQIEVILEPDSQKFLYALDRFAAPQFPNDARAVFAHADGSFELGEPLPTRERYYLYRATTPPEDPSHALGVAKPPSEKVKALLAERAGDDAEQTVAHLLELFRHDFGYTLTPPPVRTLDEFLFKTKTGFCEHFAGALATLLRYQNIPARVVVGFQGGAAGLTGHFVSVRGSDAHAWVEYFSAQAGRWVRVDPTAQVDPQRIALGAEGGRATFAELWFARGRALFDEIDARWSGTLLHFDLARQRELLASLGVDGARPAWLIASLILVTGLLFLLGRARGARLAPGDRLWRQLIATVNRRWRIAHVASEPPLAFYARIARERPELAPRLKNAFEYTLRLRFGPPERDLYARARAEVRRLKKLPRVAPRR